MVSLNRESVRGYAPDEATFKRGLEIAEKNKLTARHRTPDGSLLFGECIGSGSSTYFTSADFVREDAPVFRCSCPSKKIPCKHVLGLLLSHVQDAAAFTEAPLPEDIGDKREKARQRAEKKQAAVTAPPKTKKISVQALRKKRLAQIEGLQLFGKMLDTLVNNGTGSLSRQNVDDLAAQVKNLGNFFVPGAAAHLADIITLLEQQMSRKPEETAMDVSALFRALLRGRALVKKGVAYLESRLEQPDMPPDTASRIEELLGTAWTLADLRQYQLVKPEAELCQLAFSSSENSRGDSTDWGVWIDLEDGKIASTYTYRPYKARNHIREEDSFSGVIRAKDVCLYPDNGELNRRIRWESGTVRALVPSDLETILSFAENSFKTVFKKVKNQLKMPLADPAPLVLVRFAAILRSGNGFVLQDAAGEYLTLQTTDQDQGQIIFRLLPEAVCRNGAMLVRFHAFPEQKRLVAEPLSLVADDRLLRLTL